MSLVIFSEKTFQQSGCDRSKGDDRYGVAELTIPSICGRHFNRRHHNLRGVVALVGNISYNLTTLEVIFMTGHDLKV